MGYIRHHAIIITGGHKKKVHNAHRQAIKIFDNQVSNVLKSKMNSYYSFFIAPDGSKEGWENSDIGDTSREKFIKYIKSNYGGWLNYCEVFYGDDRNMAGIINHN